MRRHATGLVSARSAHAIGAFAFGIGVALSGCNCGEVPQRDAGPSEGEGEGDAGPTQPPTEPIRDPDPTNPLNDTLDSDCDGLSDATEFQAVYAGGGHTNPADYDSDDDGVADGVEAGATAVIDAECPATWLDADPTSTTSPVAADSDSDCIPDGREDKNINGRIDAGESDPALPDSDHDGLADGAEDANCDGVVDANETSAALLDTDGDGLSDSEELAAGTNPRSADSDGDGIPDGQDSDPLGSAADADADGVPDAVDDTPNDPDSDGDGLCDGARTVPGTCVGGEDLDGDGVVDANESDPTTADSDCDGVDDAAERTAGTAPRAADSDGDLLSDGVELGKTGPVPGTACATVAVDADPASTTDPLDADTDGDGINDGTEDRDHNGALGPAAPGGQETDATRADTDGDALCDGPSTPNAAACHPGEDNNRNGRVDANESDPRVADVDTDGDGLTNPVEARLGTNPNLPDTDGDGLLDGAEVAGGTDPLSVDSDCDGLNDADELAAGTDPHDIDTDGDGIKDGVEMGTQCSVATAQTSQACVDASRCVADADPGSTSDPVDIDTDGDQVADGAEDANQNGRVDAGELNPNNGGDATVADQLACGVGALREVILVTRPDTTADLTLAVALDFPEDRITTVTDSAGDVRGAMIFDQTDQVAGVALKLNLAGADAAAKLDTLRATLDGAVGNVASFNRQTFTSWDAPAANNAAIGMIEWADATGANTVAASMNAIVAALLPGSGGLLSTAGSSEVGSYRMQVEVLVRSPASTVVVISITNFVQAALAERRGFLLDDLTNGSAVAQFGDKTGTQCDRFVVEQDQDVDFVLVVDNSASMANEQTALAAAATEVGAQLSSSTVRWRVAVITSDVERTGSGATAWNDVDFANTRTPRYCRFTDVPADLIGCIRRDTNADGDIADNGESGLGIDGSGEETFFRATACALGRNVSGPGITTALDTANGERGGAADGEPCGRAAEGRAPFGGADTYATPPSPFPMLPRADGDARRLRTTARLAVVFVTDANEQSDGRYSVLDDAFNPAYAGDAIALHSVPTWEAFFANFDGAGDPAISKALVHGIVCPVGGDCTDEGDDVPGDEPYMNPRFARFLADVGGVEAALPNDDDPAMVAKVKDAITRILQATVAQVSPYVLKKPPISATIKVAGTFTTEGACDTADIPRSRQNGWDYDGTTNSIQFFGDCRPRDAAVGQPFSVSYKTWIEDSPDPDGNDDPCAQCEAPFICVDDQCVCAPDCGSPEGLADSQTCDVVSCTPECLPDCGGCSAGHTCDTSSPTCACGCPADCNTGGALPAGTTCDPATCLPVCAPGGCDEATRPGPAFVCGADCTWSCPSDCGGAAVGPNERCDPVTCTVECAGDCNGNCGGFLGCDADTCACACVENATCAPGFVFDTGACGCVCDGAALACPATHTANLDACRCDCGVACNDACGVGNVCNAGTCTCSTIGG